eukprot:845676_1
MAFKSTDSFESVTEGINEETGYYMILLIVLFSAPCTVAVCYESLNYYFARRRSKSNVIASAQITKAYESRGGSSVPQYSGTSTIIYHSTETTYYIVYKYRDYKTEEYTQEVLDKYINRHYGHLLPKLVINCCLEYLGNPFVFYFRTFDKKEPVSKGVYDQYYNAKTVQIMYETKYPQNCKIMIKQHDNILKRCCYYCGVCLCIITIILCTIWGMIAIIPSFLIWPAVIILETLIMMCYYCKKYEMGLFKQPNNIQSLRCELNPLQPSDNECNDGQTRLISSENDLYNTQEEWSVSWQEEWSDDDTYHDRTHFNP